MSYPQYITKLNGKYYCSLCRPNSPYCSKAYAFQHVNSKEHKMKAESKVVIEPVSVNVEVKKEEIKPSKPLMDEEAIQNIVKECLENHPLIKELKNTIDNQKSEISVLKNKNDMLLEKVRTYKEEADKLDKMVADRKKELYSEIFGGV